MNKTCSANSTKTILLVDDEESLMFFLQKLLTREGYNVIMAVNGKEAVEIYKSGSNRIDLVLMDITMPVMSGIDAYQELARFDPDVLILLMSAYSRESFDGINGLHFIRKPIFPADLISRIGELLNTTRHAS